MLPALRVLHAGRYDLPAQRHLLQDEVILLVRLFANLGFDKFRLTGGEPTVPPYRRPGSQIAGVPGVRSLSDH
jgi:cyclic pyranopterin phosphate synthase